MTALGSNARIFARSHRREDLRWCFETALGCGPVATVTYPGIAEPMLVVRFPDGGSLSIEFTDQAPDDDHPRLRAWLELRAEDPAAVMRAALGAGLPEVKAPRPPVLRHGTRRSGLHHRATALTQIIANALSPLAKRCRNRTRSCQSDRGTPRSEGASRLIRQGTGHVRAELGGLPDATEPGSRDWVHPVGHHRLV
jgi:hypothetical protein